MAQKVQFCLPVFQCHQFLYTSCNPDHNKSQSILTGVNYGRLHIRLVTRLLQFFRGLVSSIKRRYSRKFSNKITKTLSKKQRQHTLTLRTYSWLWFNFTVTPVGISLFSEIILIDFYWQLVYILECFNKIFVSPSVWMISVDTLLEGPKAEIWGWAKVIFTLFIYF